MGEFVMWEDSWNGGNVLGVKSRLKALGYTDEQINQIEDIIDECTHDTGNDE